MPLLGIVIVSIVLRAWLAIAFAPSVMNLADSAGYIQFAHSAVFNDIVHPAGYALFLKVLGWLSSSASAPIMLQHVMGIATALLAYALMRRLGAPRPVSVIPAAVVLLSLDQITLEHQFMPEALFTLVIVASAYCAVRALASSRAHASLSRPVVAWLVAAGALMGLATYVRTVALLVAPFLALWVLFALPRPWLRSRVAGAGATFAAIAVLGLVYSTAHDIKSGYFGFTEYGGWAAYVRTAQFADCSKFTPPAGTSRLCERTPSDQRNGGDFYAWEPGSPAQRTFGAPPNGAAQLGAFGRAAIEHQPLAYAETVFNDFVRFFAPTYNDDRPYGGPGFDVLDADRPGGATAVGIAQTIKRFYGAGEHVEVRQGWARSFDDLQQLLRVNGVVLLMLSVLAVAGLFAGPRAPRSAIALLLGGGMLLLLVPAATALYNARYVVPACPLVAAAAALALWSLWQRAVHGAVEGRTRPGDSP